MANLNKYVKKVIVTDEESSTKARGQRLRKIRNLANLSRKELCNTENLNLNTYKGWELARFGGLPLDGAERFIQRVAEERVICSSEWLLYGRGQEPFILPGLHVNSDVNQNELVLKEILLFQSLYPNTIYSLIKDDSLAPTYISGDYIAGIKLYGEDILTAVNQICIVELIDGRIFNQYLRLGRDKNSFELLNLNRSVETLQLDITEINFAAPIIRHYRRGLINSVKITCKVS